VAVWQVARVGRLAEAVREAAGQSVDHAYVDQGYNGRNRLRPLRHKASRWKW
jgi:hypothetical protein